jgi:predicted acylesterase/phospholipase RssA
MQEKYLNAKTKFKAFKNLVFGGGGFKGLSYVGALNSLRDLVGVDFGARTHILENVCGVSIGAFFGLLIVCGYTVSEISVVCKSIDPEMVFDFNPFNLISTNSLDNGKKLRDIIEKILQRKGFTKYTTMEQLKKVTGINFHVVVTNLSTVCTVHLTSNTHKEYLVVDALMATMALPLIFPPYTKNVQNHVWVDGGILENFPINRYPSHETLGFNFKWSIGHLQDTQMELSCFLSRIIQTTQLPLEVMTWDALSLEHKSHTVVIDCETITAVGKTNSITFNMSQKDREFLFMKAKDAVEKKIKEWENNSPYILETRDPGKFLSDSRNLPIYLQTAIEKS